MRSLSVAGTKARLKFVSWIASSVARLAGVSSSSTSRNPYQISLITPYASRSHHTGFRVNTTSNDLEPSGPVEIIPVTHMSSADESSKDDKTPRPTVTPVNCGGMLPLEDALLKVDPLCWVSTGSTR
jgi:hypothetical protein